MLMGRFVAGRTVLVRGLAPAVALVNLKSFFAFVGDISQMDIFAEKANNIRFSLVEFAEKSMVDAALGLTGTPMLGQPLAVVLATPGALPEASPAPPGPALLQAVPGAPMAGPAISQEVARTVEVTNVPLGTKAEKVKQVMESCGEVTYCKLSDDGRRAIVEYLGIDSAARALHHSGSLFMESIALTVKPVSGPILKGGPMQDEGEIQRRLRKTVERIERRILDRERGYRSRSRSPHRHSSRRSRGRDDSRERRRSSDRRRSRSRSSGRGGHSRRHRGSKDRSRDRSSRDRSRDHHSSRRSRHRSRSRSHSRDRKRKRDSYDDAGHDLKRKRK